MQSLAVLTGWPYYRGKLKFHDLKAVIHLDSSQRQNFWNIDHAILDMS